MAKDTRKSIPEIPETGSPLRLIVLVVIALGASALLTWFLIDTGEQEESARRKPAVTRKHSLPVRPIVSETPEINTLEEETALEKKQDGGTEDVRPQQEEKNKKVQRKGINFAALPQGTIDPSVVQQFIRSHSREVQQCYERALRNNNTLQGSLVIEATIHPTGKVVRARVSKDSIYDPAVKRCVITTIKRWKFPQPKGGYVTIAVPFNFTPKF